MKGNIMKKLSAFFMVGMILCSCESRVFDEVNCEAINPHTRATDISYTFRGANFSGPVTFEFNYAGENLERQNCAIFSYMTSDNVKTKITPEVTYVPSWCNVSLLSEQPEHFVYKIELTPNTGSNRSDYIYFKQPESNQTLSVNVFQYARYNKVDITMKEVYPNRPLFTATTTYPVQEEVRCYVPYEVYNDGGKMDSWAKMVISKGQTTGTFIMDYNGSPLVVHYGDIKGYRLSEGEIQAEDSIYTYSFVRYW